MPSPIKVVLPGLEKSFSKETEEMKKIVEEARQQGLLKRLKNRVGKIFDETG